jgi:radical SAM-linked protein
LRRARVPRPERLARLAARFPLYVPSLYHTVRDPTTGLQTVAEPLDARAPAAVRRVWVADINRFPFPDNSPLPHGEAVFDRMAVEIARGCTEGCRFCQAGVVYRPVRERDPVAVVDALVEGIRKGGYDETSLASLSPADYSCVSPLVQTAIARLRERKVSLSVSSLRAYGLSDDLLGEMASLGMSGLTFSPEAGTQRMRDVVSKNVSEADILESAHRVFSRGQQRMKLYFMIGLPSETDDDVIGIVETTARVQEIGRRYLRGAKVTAAVSVFVPKPHTPLQWAAMDSRELTAHKQSLLTEHARRLRVVVKMHDNTQSHLEAIFARGDRACADLLERAFRLGCRFDGWDDGLRADLWERAIAEERAGSGFDPERYLGSFGQQDRLPWNHIDTGVDRDFLRAEYQKALTHRLSPPCGKAVRRLLHPSNVVQAVEAAAEKLVCYDCGVACDLDQMKRQRLYFLRRMNAWAPVERPAAAARPAAGKRATAPRPLTRFVQGEARRYRLRYTKLGPATYLAHLDLVRHLPRIFRRADLDIAYSRGFHPKPGLCFGPALGLGLPSLGELLDVKLGDEITPAELLRRLNAVSLPGIEFLAAAVLQESEPALGRVLARAQYAVLLPDGLCAATAVAAYAFAAPLLAARREREDSRKSAPTSRVDVRPSLTDVAAASEEDARLLAAKLDWLDASPERVLIFGVKVSALGSARPVEVVEAFTDPTVAREAPIARLGLWAAAERATPEGEGRTQEAGAAFVDPLQLNHGANAPG